jgi:type IV pilus assembly protein PilY1
MFKDRATGSSGAGQATITEADVYDATADALQTASGTALVTEQAALLAAKGWMITLGAGEKVVGGVTTIAGTTYFNTNQPASTAPTNACTTNLGVARAYAIGFADATAANNNSPATSASMLSRFTIIPGGGYLPSPVSVVVKLNGKIVQGVISGTYVQPAPSAKLNWRYRMFWQILHD